jgi:hypothetical protein
MKKLNVKFCIGDTVWFISSNKLTSAKVTEICITSENEIYKVDTGHTYFNTAIHATKKDLWKILIKKYKEENDKNRICNNNE